MVHVQFPSQGYRGNLPWQLPVLLHASGFTVVQTWHEYVAARVGVALGTQLTFVEKLRLALPQAPSGSSPAT